MASQALRTILPPWHPCPSRSHSFASFRCDAIACVVHLGLRDRLLSAHGRQALLPLQSRCVEKGAHGIRVFAGNHLPRLVSQLPRMLRQTQTISLKVCDFPYSTSRACPSVGVVVCQGVFQKHAENVCQAPAPLCLAACTWPTGSQIAGGHELLAFATRSGILMTLLEASLHLQRALARPGCGTVVDADVPTSTGGRASALTARHGHRCPDS